MNTKFFIALLFLGLSTISCSDPDLNNKTTDNSEGITKKVTKKLYNVSQDKTNLTGHWHWESKSSNFDLDIIQNNDSLKGSYCAVAYNGNRIDCNDNDSDGYCLISGILQKDKASITFNSAYSEPELKDTAEIIYNPADKTLLWTWTQKNIVAYVPKKAVLKQ